MNSRVKKCAPHVTKKEGERKWGGDWKRMEEKEGEGDWRCVVFSTVYTFFLSFVSMLFLK